MTGRFAILHHRTSEGEHWDLMVEHGDWLLTWQLDACPDAFAQWPIKARRIADHRKIYLDYEGPISGDRGHVVRVDQGAVRILELTPTNCLIHAGGTRLLGRYELIGEGLEWELRCAKLEP